MDEHDGQPLILILYERESDHGTFLAVDHTFRQEDEAAALAYVKAMSSRSRPLYAVGAQRWGGA